MKCIFFIGAVRLCMVFYVASHMIRRVESSVLLPWSDLSGMFSFVLVPGFLPARLSIIKNITILFWKLKEVLINLVITIHYTFF